MENQYTDFLEKLKLGEIQEIVVERDDFFVFREAWLARSDRTEFVGEAGLNGKIIYRYLEKKK
ncbi:hypothetical protein [Enterococcus olivae]